MIIPPICLRYIHNIYHDFHTPNDIKFTLSGNKYKIEWVDNFVVLYGMLFRRFALFGCDNKPLGISKYFLTQRVVKNYELSNDKKISTPFIFDILQDTVLHTFPDNILATNS